jgi:N,N'-diacetyllegionaminate synthase
MNTKRRNKILIIAEVGQNHDGSLGQAHAFIDAVARTGANAVKFQTHIAEAESTPSEPFRVHFSYEDASRFDYWRRMEFTKGQWRGLKKHAEDRGLLFMSSPFSMEAIELLTDIGVQAWKVGSGEINSYRMLRRMAETRRPLYISTGMSSFAEIDQTTRFLEKVGATYTLLQCMSAYPCGPEHVGLNVISQLRDRYHCPVGLSDHSGTIYPAIAAVTQGVTVIEIHVTLSREMFGPDISASLTTEDLRRLVDGVRFLEKTMNNPVDKDAEARRLAPMRRRFGKSAIAKRDLQAGRILSAESIDFKKPGSGLSEPELLPYIGSRLVRTLKKGQMIQKRDIHK